MKRLIIICEGETEREFCNKVLAPYFAAHNIYVQAPLIKKSMGGIVKWPDLKKQIENHLKNEQGVFVTTLIDYYGLYGKFEFPGWADALNINDKNLRLAHLETSMRDDVNEDLKERFLPYLQLHEFEGLLFSNQKVFYEQIPEQEIIGKAELTEIFERFTNPEMINDIPANAPSKRLVRIIKGYDKVLYGHYLAEAIGLEKIKEKCPRFSSWLLLIHDL